jgi:hypothetical protein
MGGFHIGKQPYLDLQRPGTLQPGNLLQSHCIPTLLRLLIRDSSLQVMKITYSGLQEHKIIESNLQGKKQRQWTIIVLCFLPLTIPLEHRESCQPRPLPE